MKKKNSDLLRLSSLICLFRNSFFFSSRASSCLSLSLSIKSERDSLGMIILMEALKGGMVSSKSRERLCSSRPPEAFSSLSHHSRPKKIIIQNPPKAELRDCPDFPARLSTAARHARLIAEELTGQVALIPFALRALSERRRAKKEGRLVEGVRYGPRERQVADLWLPPRGESDEGGKRPPPPAIAVLFHGGTWTAGDKVRVSSSSFFLKF